MSYYRFAVRRHHRYRMLAIWHRGEGRQYAARDAARIARSSLSRAIHKHMEGRLPPETVAEKGMPRRRVRAFLTLFPSLREA